MARGERAAQRTIAAMVGNKAPIAVGGHLLRELAVAVPCDPRTLKKALAGGSVSTMRLVAIKRTLAARGLLDLLREQGRRDG